MMRDRGKTATEAKRIMDGTKKAMAAALLALALAPGGARGLGISDSSDSGLGQRPVNDSIEATNKIMAVSHSIPVGTIIVWSSPGDPEDAEAWLECDGRAVDPDDYPALYAMMHNTPNFTGRFLRAGDASTVGTVREDTIKSHESKIAPHTHAYEGGTTESTFSITLPERTATGSISGTAAGQDLSSGKTASFDRLRTASSMQASSDGLAIQEMYRYIDWVPFHDPLCSYRIGGTFYKDGTYTDPLSPCATSYCNYVEGRTFAELLGKTGAEVHSALVDSAITGRTIATLRGCNRDDFAEEGTEALSLTAQALRKCKISSTNQPVAATLQVVIAGHSLPMINVGQCKLSGPQNTTGTLSLTGTAKPSAVTGTSSVTIPGQTATGELSGGGGSFSLRESEELTAVYTGAEETAPKHVYVRFLIRAIP